MNVIVLGLTFLSLGIWVGLLGFRGRFWQTDCQLEVQSSKWEIWPSVCVVIPARNEADLLPITLYSILKQDYPGNFSVILVDDSSTDGTGTVAQEVAEDLHKSWQIKVISAQSLPANWTGKLWAMEQGVCHSQKLTPTPDYYLFTDADIEHDTANLRELVTKAKQENLDLVSFMVRLRCESFWEKFLIPAFVFFFQKLYPFRWVNNPNNSTAAAAGGCILIASDALNRIGGIQVIRQALIDDCALAKAVKSSYPQKSLLNPLTSPLRGEKEEGIIWLGLSNLTRSLRPYPSLASIWNMVARTAFTQLNYSPLLLLSTVLAMTLIYLVSPVAAIWGGLTGNWLIALAGLSGWLLMVCAYFPILMFYQCSPLLAFCLPIIALFYTLMTVDSARLHWGGKGGAWKGREYS
ncbi:MAG: glycosyltransferase [Potamolinea sp.]